MSRSRSSGTVVMSLRSSVDNADIDTVVCCFNIKRIYFFVDFANWFYCHITVCNRNF